MTSHFPRFRFFFQAGFDAWAWLVGMCAAAVFRYDFSLSSVPWGGVLAVAALAMIVQITVGRLIGLYVHRWRYGTIDEVAATVRTVLTTTVVITLIDLIPGLGRPVPFTVAIVSGFLALFVMCCGRFAWRIQLDKWHRFYGDDRIPAVVFGAGEAGSQLVKSMIHTGPYHPVAVLDDNHDLGNLQIKGVRVRGDRSALKRIVAETDAEVLVIAIPSAGSELLRDLSAVADEIGIKTYVLPPVGELLGQNAVASDIQPLTEADLLGRREITLDIDSVADYLTGKRVLVTGAGGSIGSELCRQLNRFAPESLVMLDRDESALQAVQVSIEGRGLLDSRNLVVCCIRDRDRLTQVFEEHRPQVVFHAAALKHLPLLELHPEEGWKSNVWGTQNLLELAGEFGVEKFVNISTDKAAEPTSVLGQTKRLAEQLTSHAGRTQSGTYLSVRFGNVLGSRGSVLPLFRAQIESGGPVTVTDPEVTRFFMTIPEACELVVQAGALGADGEVMVLDMGEPVRIADLAKRLVAQSDRPVEIVYTGLRPGEKMHEILFAPEEESTISEHPMIHRVGVPPLSAVDVAKIDPYLGSNGAIVLDLSGRQSDAVAETLARRSS
ncbi:MAG: polysaccharide biosynthesis protein [Microthrixaceae bacterium]